MTPRHSRGRRGICGEAGHGDHSEQNVHLFSPRYNHLAFGIIAMMYDVVDQIQLCRHLTLFKI